MHFALSKRIWISRRKRGTRRGRNPWNLCAKRSKECQTRNWMRWLSGPDGLQGCAHKSDEVRMTMTAAEHGVSPPKVSLPLLEVEHLRTHFPIRKGFLRSVVGYVKAV